MQDYKKLLVWQKAHQLTLSVYRVSNTLPKTELYGLTSQLRRCSVSIGSHIAEGSVQGSDPQFARYLHIALGSAAELDYQVLFAHELEYMDKQEYEKLQNDIDQLKKMLSSFIQKLKA